MTGPCGEIPVFGQDPHKYHGACHRDGDTRDHGFFWVHADGGQSEPGEQGGEQAGEQRARDGHAPDGDEFVQVEFEADSEHEQDDAHLGELFGDLDVGCESRGVGTDGYPGQEEPDHR